MKTVREVLKKAKPLKNDTLKRYPFLSNEFLDKTISDDLLKELEHRMDVNKEEDKWLIHYWNQINYSLYKDEVCKEEKQQQTKEDKNEKSHINNGIRYTFTSAGTNEP